MISLIKILLVILNIETMSIQLPEVPTFLGFTMLDKIIIITKMEIFPTTTFIKNTIRTFKWRLVNFTVFYITNTISTFQYNHYWSI